MSRTDRYLRIIKKKHIPLTRAEEIEMFTRAKNGDMAAYDLIIKSNLRFVVSVAKHYENKGLDLDELIQEGNYGLIKAFHKFDISRNCKFITYAVWWIRQTILNAIHDNSNTVRIPVNKITNISKTNKLRDELEQELSQQISINDLLPYMENPDMAKDMKYVTTMVDIDKTQTDNLKSLHEVIAIEDPPLDDTEEFKKDLDNILKHFTERERKIIYMYYGINYPRSYTLKEIGFELNLTRERVRQIKKQVIEKLRKRSDIGDLRDYMT